MAIKRQAGETTLKVFLLEDDAKTPRTGSGGEKNLVELVSELKIIESISSPTIRAELSIFDATDFINTLHGNDYWKIELEAGEIKQTYIMQCYEINSRLREEKKEAYVINLVSTEFIYNETINIFGAKKPKDAAVHIKEIVKEDGGNGLASGKKLFSEATKKFRFTSVNWRPFDAINFICSKVVRSSSTGDVEQGAFVFFENAKGFHFKSIDKMIEDCVANKDKSTYVYGQKSIEDNPLKNQFLIDRVNYPTSFNALKSLRMGAWSGYVMGLDPTSFGESNLPTKSKKVAAKTSWYGYEKTFKSMSILEKGGKIPVDTSNARVKDLLNRPKRIKYKILPTHLYDLPTTKNRRQFKQWEQSNTLKNQGKNLDHHIDTASYNFLRKKAIEAIQLVIEVPGNLGLYAGEGIKVEIPRMLAKGSKVELDKMYSGNYLIGGVVHTYKTTNTQTTLHLLKDSIKV